VLLNGLKKEGTKKLVFIFALERLLYAYCFK